MEQVDAKKYGYDFLISSIEELIRNEPTRRTPRGIQGEISQLQAEQAARKLKLKRKAQ